MRGKIGQQLRLTIAFVTVNNLKIAVTDYPAKGFVYSALSQDLAKSIDEYEIIIPVDMA